MNVGPAQDLVMTLYPLLDSMQDVFKIIGNGFRVSAPGLGDVQLPPDRVVEIKNKFMQLRSQIQKAANAIPEVEKL